MKRSREERTLISLPMTLTLLPGLLGSLVLIAGAAWPDRPTKHPARSVKNRLFAIGAVLMLLYSILQYLEGGPVFFVFLQVFVNVASVFMMLNVNDRIDTPVLATAGLIFIVLSLFLFEGVSTIFFILGLTGIGMGYAMDGGTVRREVVLMLGSACIALFSYIEASWIFCWLNIFFALFSAWHAWKLRYRK
jgi:hypothetical protein